MKKIAIICSVVFLFSCQLKTEINKSGFFDFPAFFEKEAKQLDLNSPLMVRKTVSEGESVNTFDSAVRDWKKELQLFEIVNLNAVKNKNIYSVSVDSSKGLSIERYTTEDTTVELQEVSITRKNNRIELVEAFTKLRSFWVDREMRLSYQPYRGYGMLITEDYIWSKKSTREIYAEIDGTLSGFMEK
jgi:hypothetical protein